jgi:hypothetical protein
MEFTVAEIEHAPGNEAAFNRWLTYRLGRPPTGIETANARAVVARLRRAAWTSRTYSDRDYPAALAMLMRTAGKPRLPVNGRSAWAIVEGCDAEVASYLHGLGNDPRDWKDVQREVRLATMKAALAARAAYKAGNEAKASRLLRMAWTEGATAYVAKSKWHQRAQLAAVDLSADDLVPDDPEPDDGGEAPPPAPAGGQP